MSPGGDKANSSNERGLQDFSRRHLAKAAGAALIASTFPLLSGGCAPTVSAGIQGDVETRSRRHKRPNFLVIVADDLGYSDLGCYGSEIRTPNLDALARSGLRLSDFHVAPACSPTRVMLMTGVDHHLAGIGSMNEVVMPGFKGAPGYEGHINDRVVAVSELLRDAGYRTAMAGKWHLGDNPHSWPAARGFERSFCLLPAGADHWASGPFFHLNPNAPLYVEDREYVRELPGDFYSSDYFTGKLIDYLDEEPDRPFFAYLPFSAPHWPLHAPKEDIERYRGVYDDGPETLREKRLEGLKRQGIVPGNVKAHGMQTSVPSWDEMTPEERAFSARTMEVYAAMVDRLDQNVGRLVAHLKSTGRFDDTVIFFLSDNGAEGVIAEAYPVFGPVFSKLIADHADNSLANLGLPQSCIWYGPRWAQAATAPLKLMKSYTTEGGIRVPAFVSGLGGNWIGQVSDSFTTVMDIAPTILELAGVVPPEGEYAGRPVHPMQGRSLLPWLQGLASDPHPAGTATGWELFGRRAIRQDDWKLVFTPGSDGSGTWELYNVEADPGETEDLSRTHPAKVKQLIELWEGYVRKNGVLLDLQTIYQAKM